MKAFIRQFIYLLSICVMVLLCYEIAISIYITRIASFKIEKKPEILILGSSHPECAYNDTLIAKTYNSALSSEAYFYTYFKLNQLLHSNPSINTVLIEFANWQISTNTTNFIWDNDHLNYTYSLLSPFIDLKSKCLLFSKNPTGFFNAYAITVKNNVNWICNNDLNFTHRIGGYLYLKRDKTKALLNEFNELNATKIDTSYSITNISYLQKIVALCREKNIKIYFIKTPTHPKAGSLQNETQLDKIKTTYFPEIEYLNFVKFPLQNTEYGDLTHLNYKGARRFSIWINKLFSDSLLMKKDKQLIIDQEIKNVKLNTPYETTW